MRTRGPRTGHSAGQTSARVRSVNDPPGGEGEPDGSIFISRESFEIVVGLRSENELTNGACSRNVSFFTWLNGYFECVVVRLQDFGNCAIDAKT